MGTIDRWVLLITIMIIILVLACCVQYWNKCICSKMISNVFALASNRMKLKNETIPFLEPVPANHVFGDNWWFCFLPVNPWFREPEKVLRYRVLREPYASSGGPLGRAWSRYLITSVGEMCAWIDTRNTQCRDETRRRVGFVPFCNAPTWHAFRAVYLAKYFFSLIWRISTSHMTSFHHLSLVSTCWRCQRLNLFTHTHLLIF